MTDISLTDNARDASARLAQRPRPADFVVFDDAAVASVPARFALMAELHGDRDAIRTDHTNCTYTELAHGVNGLAAAIRREVGDEPEPVIALVSGDVSPSLAALAVMTAGHIHVPIDSTTPEERVRQIANDSGARLIISDAENRSVARAIGTAQVLELDAVDPSPTPVSAGIDPDQICRILYTSGSTGTPKGVTRTHRELLASIAAPANRYGITPRDRIGMIGSSAFAGSISDMFLALLTGACLLPFDLKRRGFAQMRSWMRHDMPTTFYMVPSVFRTFARTLPADIRFESVHTIRFGADSLVPADLEAVRRHFCPDVFAINNLGSTEIGVYARFVVDSHTELGDAVPVGYPVPGVEVSVVDDDNQPLAPGERGCFVVRLRTHTRYWNGAHEQNGAFSQAGDGWTEFQTGDRGYLDTDGCLHYLGRCDRLMKVRGNRVESAEVETAVRAVPGVHDVAVRGVDYHGSTAVVAYVVSPVRPALTDADLRQAVADDLPDYAIPTIWVHVDEMPRTNRGKVDWDALPEPDIAAVPDDFDDQVTELEQALIELWAKELKVGSVGLHDDFFDLGGTSLDAMSMFAAVNTKLGYDIAPTTLMRASTVSELASVIESGAGRGSDASLIPLRVKGARRPFFVVHGGGGGVFFVGRMLDHIHEDRPLYGLQAAGFEATPPPYRSVPEMAERYVSELRAVQANGPYAIAGLSLGGVIAWEMAQQLQAAGEEVAMLGMIDTKPVSSFSRAGRADITNQAAGLGKALSQSIPARAWRKMQRIIRGCALKLWLMTGRPLPETFKLRQSYFWPLHARAARAYQPEAYQGDVTIVSEQGAVDVHRELWADLVHGEISITEVGTHHLGLDRDPFIAEVAGAFEHRLQQVEGDITSAS